LAVTGLLLQLPDCEAYCALLGANPGFREAPHVEQVTLTSVRVSWQGIVSRIECADQFIVKSWNQRNPNDYKMSDLLPLDQFVYIVTDLVPNQDYVFQAVAREDKGILGKDWNKSPQAMFRTSRTNPTVPPNSENTFISATELGPLRSNGSTGTSPQNLFAMGAIIIGSLLGVLILVGILWNIIDRGRKRKTTDGDSDSHSDSETDSMDLDLENTDLESRVGSIRPPSRATSRGSTVRGSTLSTVRGNTLRVRSPVRRFSFTPSEPPDYGKSYEKYEFEAPFGVPGASRKEEPTLTGEGVKTHTHGNPSEGASAPPPPPEFEEAMGMESTRKVVGTLSP